MKILVTGGAEYIGAVLVEMLFERGYDVRILDRVYWGTCAGSTSARTTAAC